MKNLIFKLMSILILMGSLGLGWLMMDYQQFIDTPISIADKELRIEINAGDNLHKLSRKLYQQNIISNPRYMVWKGKLSNSADHIKIGEYQFKPGTTPAQLLEKIIRGDTIQYSATIIEGMTFKELLHVLAQNKHLTHTLKGVKYNQVMKKLGYPRQHPEGRFLPDTYHFPRNTTDVEFLKRAYVAMQQFLEAEWENRAVGLPLKDPYEALILASIVEKETGVPTERGMIAGVFSRRLQKNMRLQTDPTVIYGMGDKYKGNIRRKDLKQDTPYNTYRIKGLPPTPIAMPGKDAIKAALNPTEGDELYFVAKGDGSHIFTSNLNAHNNAVIKYQLKGKRKSFSSMPKK